MNLIFANRALKITTGLVLAALSLSAQSLEEKNTEPDMGFIRGNKTIFSDNFEKDAQGDFPARWTTTQGGSVVKLTGFSEKYLKVPAEAVVSPVLSKGLPEHFTVEFDCILPADVQYRRIAIGLGNKLAKVHYNINDRHAITFDIQSTDFPRSKSTKFSYGVAGVLSAKSAIEYTAPLNKKIHFGIMVNGTRIRCFVDGRKMVDLPDAFKPTLRKFIFFNTITSGAKETKLGYNYISNIVIAEAGQDARSKVLKDLMENGSFSTNAILFSKGSDKILPNSYPILNEIKKAIDEVEDLQLKITGHTDTDGNAAQNLALSKKRAEAVKKYLIIMGVAGNRLTTDGKGGTVPVEDNSTEEGKAQNRRVEFTKIN